MLAVVVSVVMLIRQGGGWGGVVAMVVVEVEVGMRKDIMAFGCGMDG